MAGKGLAKIAEDAGVLGELTTNDQFLTVVNNDPPVSVVKEHPFAKGVKYLPIEYVENLLTTIFQDWYVEIIDSGQLLNAVFVNVRLHYRHPVLKEWRHQDGTGAMDVQTESGKSASDLAAIRSNAVMKALPAAKSYAIKDAAEHIGKLFGRDLNRKDAPDFEPIYQRESERQYVKERQAAFAEAKTLDELRDAWVQTEPKTIPELVKAKDKRKQELEQGNANTTG